MKYIIRLPKSDVPFYGDKAGKVVVEVELRKGQEVAPHQDIDLLPCREYVEFSACASIWDRTRRRDPITCGQCLGAVAELYPKDIRVQRIVGIWHRWHLNGMRAGTRKQQEHLRAHPFDPRYPKSHYDWACEELARAELLQNMGYKYGSAWLIEPLPSEIEAEVKAICAELGAEVVK